jgi:hypothetical protein
MRCAFCQNGDISTDKDNGETPGVLSEEERTMLERQWREDFERSWSPNFSFFSGGKIYSGDDARELHWLWADLPPELHERWMAARQRSCTIRELQEEG